MMIDYINQLSQMIETVNPKLFSRYINARPDLKDWLFNETAQYNPININEQVWIIFNSPPVICKNGNKPLFNSYTHGYRSNCGTASACLCAKESQSLKMKNWQSNLDDTSKHKMLEKSKKTFLKNHGVENPMHSDIVKDKLKKTNQEKYGVDYAINSDAVKSKLKDTFQEKYGVDYPFQNKEVRGKSIDTTLDRYGTLMSHARTAAYDKYNGNNPFTDPTVKDKIKATMLTNHGVEHALKSKIILDKMKANILAEYGVENVNQVHLDIGMISLLADVDKFKEFAKGKTVKEISDVTGYSSTHIYKYIKKYNIEDIVHPVSLMQEDLRAWLDDNNISYIENNRSIIKPFELDFYIPKYNLGIELNGLVSHSELKAGKDSSYHKMKHSMTADLGIKLLQIWQDEYWLKNKIVKDKIAHLCKLNLDTLHPRKTIITLVKDVNVEREFYDNNHIQGFPEYRSATIGAFINNKLVAAMSWAIVKGQMEMIRFATLIAHKSPGMFTKLLTSSIKQLELNGLTIVTYSDNRYSNGDLYLKTGWVQTKILPPDYCYTSNYSNRENKQKYMKSKIMKRFNLPISKLKLTEWELMQELGYDRLWDAGKIKWTKIV